MPFVPFALPLVCECGVCTTVGEAMSCSAKVLASAGSIRITVLVLLELAHGHAHTVSCCANKQMALNRDSAARKMKEVLRSLVAENTTPPNHGPRISPTLADAINTDCTINNK